jgi:hypothetical protein
MRFCLLTSFILPSCWPDHVADWKRETTQLVANWKRETRQLVFLRLLSACSHVPCHEPEQPHPATASRPHDNFSQTLPARCPTSKEIVVQGKYWNVGSFGDPVSAAMCYDREAARAHGAAAILNFPTSAGMVGQPPLLPGNGEFSEEEPSALAAGSSPAGNAHGSPVPYFGPKVRVTLTHQVVYMSSVEHAPWYIISMSCVALGSSCTWFYSGRMGPLQNIDDEIIRTSLLPERECYFRTGISLGYLACLGGGGFPRAGV